NSLALNPFYVSDTELRVNQAQLEGAGISIEGVTIDINGDIRTNTPDIGATEFEACIDDAGINQIINPTSPMSSSTQEILLGLQNHGTNILTTTTIQWEVNGVLQTPFDWTGSLVSKSSEEITLGNHTFSGANLYDLKTWTENPNGNNDCNNVNDTSKVAELVTALCGTYT
ncbi:MAG: hypothetical protein JXR10_18435, partial [Cyclobacteriaceae bacterium]